MEDIKNGKSEDCFAGHLYLKREEYGLTDNGAMFAGNTSPGQYSYACLGPISQITVLQQPPTPMPLAPLSHFNIIPIHNPSLPLHPSLSSFLNPSNSSTKRHRRRLRYHPCNPQRLHHRHGRRSHILDSSKKRS